MGDDPCLARTSLLHFGQLTFTSSSQFFNNSARVVIVHVNSNLFNRLQPFSLFAFAQKHLWARNGQLKSFTPHILDQDPHLQLAAASHIKGFTTWGIANLNRYIAFRFFQKTLTNDTALYLFTVAPG